MAHTAREVHELKAAPKVEGVLPIFHERWSPRFFEDRDISPETLAKLFEAARWAASSSNEQPWRYMVGVRGTETHKKIYDSLVVPNQKWAGNAPTLVLGFASSKFGNGRDNRFALYDLGASTAYLVLEAAAIGLTAHQMGGFDQDKARAAFTIPEDYLIGSVTAIGYQAAPPDASEDELVKRELAPRTRKPLSEFVFSARDVPAKLG